MLSQTYKVPYSRSSLDFTLLPGMKADIAVSQPADAIQDVPTAIKAALEAAGIEFIEADDGAPGIIVRLGRDS